MTALSIQDVSYAYGAKTALDTVSFELDKGEFCALLGPNGAGKSTLFSLLTRLLVTRAGNISVAGHNLSKAPRLALAKLGVVFQSPTLDLDMTVGRNLRYFAALQGMSSRASEPRIEAALEKLDMAGRIGEKVGALNGGHRRRMEIARALIHQPEVLLLDEPTVGLDAASRQGITEHVHALTDTGLTVFWATHLVDEIAPEDTVVVIHQGQILAKEKARIVAGDTSLLSAFMAMTGQG